MKLTNAEKKYVKSHKEMPESAKCCLELVEAEGSDPEGNMPAEKCKVGPLPKDQRSRDLRCSPFPKQKGTSIKISESSSVRRSLLCCKV